MQRDAAARDSVLVELALVANVVGQLRFIRRTRGTRCHDCASLVLIACRTLRSLRTSGFDNTRYG